MSRFKLFTKIFLDSANPQESRKAKELLGFLDGQTTNPTILINNPEIQKRIENDKNFSEQELYSFYKNVVSEVSGITSGPISIEVYSDKFTQAKEMLKEAQEMAQWIPNAYIKLPITKEGLETANLAVKMDIPVNMTLCFSQEQAAAVYAATEGAKGPVFVSPFVGRLDDRGENGMDLIKNILKMYQAGDGHVLVLTASVRNLNHLLSAIKIHSPLVTAPLGVIKEWADKNFIIPDESFKYSPENLQSIPYRDISLNQDWQKYNINHYLTDIGLEKFSADWNKIIKIIGNGRKKTKRN